MHAIVDGTENQMESCFSRMKRDGPISWLAGTTCREAPDVQAASIDITDKSKVSSNVWETRSSGANSKRFWNPTRKSDILPTEIITPFGNPVVPEVNIR